MLKILVILAATGFFLNSGLHALLIAGYPLGEYVLGGKYVRLPSKMKIVSACFFLIWLVVGLSYLSYGQVLPDTVLGIFDKPLIILTTIFLFFAIFSNAFLTNSEKERKLMTPFCLIMFVLSCMILFM